MSLAYFAITESVMIPTERCKANARLLKRPATTLIVSQPVYADNFNRCQTMCPQWMPRQQHQLRKST
uniref:Uncharacterized protein n=1 Tax=Heterorhabditis bacteriophora TaxID=37862 RepID=A0A1I7WPD4_HETBA